MPPQLQGGAPRSRPAASASRRGASRGPRPGGSWAPHPQAASFRAPFDFSRLLRILGRVGIGVVAVAIAVFVYFALPVTIQVNGEEVSTSRGTTYQGLIDQGYLDVKPGNLLAVDGSVIEEDKGKVPVVYNDDEQVALVSLVSESGNITAQPGEDAMEPYHATTQPIPVGTEVARDKQAEAEGADAGAFNFYNGVLHIVTRQGSEGVAEVRTGDISGHEATVELEAMSPRVIENVHSVLPDDKKLIALTFDDGPSPNENETQAVLDVLAKNGVKATFFMLGSEAEQYPEMARKVVDAGHQAASHSYSHAAEHYLSQTSEDDVRAQLSQARQAIGVAVGYEPTLVRPPGGNIDIDAIKAAGTLADGYIGWSIDPHDYDRPGADAIAKTIIDQASPGAIVLLHDGGGDRSQTVKAIGKAIPALKKKGYTFVTIDELIAAKQASGS